MMCPHCQSPTRCNHTYHLDDGSVKRRRRCVNCRTMITTMERIDTDTTIQGRDAMGRYVCLPEAVPLGHKPAVPDCKRCEHWWAGRCARGHTDPATCGAFVSHRRAR